MKDMNTTCTEIHYAQVGDYQLPLLTLPQTNDPEPLGKVWPDASDLPQNPASGAVLPDSIQRLTLAAFAGSPENGLRVAGTHNDSSVRQVPCARQRARTAPLGGAHEWAESAGRGSSVEGDCVCRIIPDSHQLVSKVVDTDFTVDF